MSSIINATTTAGVTVTGDNSGSLQLATNNGTTALTIDTSQKVGIGTASPAEKLNVVTSSGSVYTNITNGTGQVYVGVLGTNLGYFGTVSNHAQTFYTNNTERMRIDSSGDVLIGTATQNTLDGGKLQVLQSADNCAVFRTTSTNYQIVCQGGQGSNIGNQILFRYGNSVVGNIVSTNSTTSYNTSSDYRLKENIAPMTGALAKVSQLKPCTYTWKIDGSSSQGFIAHELQAIVPECVNGEKDAVDDNGNPIHQGVDTSFLVATLTAAIQELKAELDATKAEVQALKGTL